MNLKTLALLIWVTLVPLVVLAFQQDTAKTRAYIIGVVHEHKKYRNADSLLIILNNIKPDLILVEMDTLTWMFNSDYSLYKHKGWENEKRKLRFKKVYPRKTKPHTSMPEKTLQCMYTHLT
jgi:hypothetical protein